MFKLLYDCIKSFFESKSLILKIKILELEKQKIKCNLGLALYKVKADLQIEKIKTSLESEKQLLFQRTRKPMVKEFDSGQWSAKEGSKQALNTLIEQFQIENQFLYKRELDRWNVATDNKKFPSQMKAKVIFSDHLVSVLDPKDKAFELIIEEAKELVPQLLLHPNEEVRMLVERYLKTKGD